MKLLKIICDTHMGETALKLLQDGVAPHQVIFPVRPASSVLAISEPDPAYAEADIAFGQPSAAAVRQAAGLRWLQVASAGYTRFDTPEFRAAASSHGLMVTNSSRVFASPCAEHLLAFMLAQSRQLPRALASREANGTEPWNRLRHGCISLSHQRVILLGLGAIAIRLIELLRPFEMQISAFRRRARGDEGVPVITQEKLPAALAEADHVINILPDNAGSRHFCSPDFFAAVKRGAIFYNIGRGTTVDQAALGAALHSGRLGGAWLDVTDPEPLPPEHPLLSAPNCYITPHIGGGHRHEAESLVRHFVKNFQRFLSGLPLEDRVM